MYFYNYFNFENTKIFQNKIQAICEKKNGKITRSWKNDS